MNAYKLSKHVACLLFSGAMLTQHIQASAAHVSAIQDEKVQIAVAKASKSWKDAFNSGNAAGAAALYEDDAIMVVKPFGTFKGKKAILAFWTDLVNKGLNVIGYDKAQVSADWEMNNAEGVITKELWVLQPDGRALLREDHFEVKQ